VLLITGIGGSMLWWDERFCRMLADGGRYVIRYDLRDAGRSVTYEPGRPGYDGADLIADALGVLEAYGLRAAHIVGVSAGGGLGQEIALEFPERVLSLTLISTSTVTGGDRRLPPPSDAFMRFVAGARVDWSDPASVVEYLVAYSQVLAGPERPFDEAAFRDLAEREVERARDIEALQNHDHIPQGEQASTPLSGINAPTLVIHGTADPMFPVEHGEALTDEIPGARLLRLEGAGHGLYRDDWETVAAAILDHTAAVS
jgi:pimeloyl-ACP methyl ester carboxylesterase